MTNAGGGRREPDGLEQNRTEQNQTQPEEQSVILTLIPVPNGVEVDIEVVFEEEQAEPAVKSVDRDNEEDADNVLLFRWHRVVA